MGSGHVGLGGLSLVALALLLASCGGDASIRAIQEHCDFKQELQATPISIYRLPPVDLDDDEGLELVASIPADMCHRMEPVGRAPSGLTSAWILVVVEANESIVEGWVFIGRPIPDDEAIPVVQPEPLALKGLPDLAFGSFEQLQEVGDPCSIAGPRNVLFLVEIVNLGAAATPPAFEVSVGGARETVELWRGLEPGESISRTWRNGQLLMLDPPPVGRYLPGGSLEESNEENNLLELPKRPVLMCG